MHLTEFAACTVLIPRYKGYVNARIFFILTAPNAPAAIANGLRRGELAAILPRRSLEQYRMQNLFISNSFCISPFRYTKTLSCRFTVVKYTDQYTFIDS